MKNAIKIWKKNQVKRAVMEFYCGGDSMGDYEFYYETEDGTKQIPELTDYFDSEVYNNVDFYVNSDGHYMGESGIVHIEFDEGEGEFTYCKSSTSEYNESINSILEIKINEEQKNFVRENIRSINGGEGENVNFNYSRNFILTEDLQRIQDELEKLIDEETCNYEPKINVGGELREYFRFETEDDFFLQDNVLSLNMTNEITIFVEDDY